MNLATTSLTTEDLDGPVAEGIRAAIAHFAAEVSAKVASEIGRRSVWHFLPDVVSHVRDKLDENLDESFGAGDGDARKRTALDRQRLIAAAAYRYAYNRLRSSARRDLRRSDARPYVAHWPPRVTEALGIEEDMVLGVIHRADREERIRRVLKTLSEREREMMRLLGTGPPYPSFQDVHRLLGVSRSTAARDRESIRSKFFRAGFRLRGDKRTDRATTNVRRMQPKLKPVEVLPDGRAWFSAQALFEKDAASVSRRDMRDPTRRGDAA